MISLSEAKPAMVRRTDGWVSAIVRGCLGGMGELRDDELASWLDADVRVLNSYKTEYFFTLGIPAAGGGSHGRYVPACVRTIARQARMRSGWKGGSAGCGPTYSWHARVA